MTVYLTGMQSVRGWGYIFTDDLIHLCSPSIYWHPKLITESDVSDININQSITTSYS